MVLLRNLEILYWLDLSFELSSPDGSLMSPLRVFRSSFLDLSFAFPCLYPFFSFIPFLSLVFFQADHSGSSVIQVRFRF